MSQTIRVELPEEGDGKYVEILNPLLMRRKDFKALQKRDDETDEQFGDRYLRSIVTGGNLTAEDGRLLQYPLNDDDIEETTSYLTVMISQAIESSLQGVAPKN